MRYITLEAAENIIQATGFSAQLDVPINRHLTISWAVADVPGRVSDAQGKFLELASKWLRYHSVTPAYVYVIENGPVLGLHSHIAIHIPDELAREFRKMTDRWVRSLGGSPRTKGALLLSPKDKFAPRSHHQSIRHLLRYILKGTEQSAADLLNINTEYTKAGVVIGRRCGTSENIGKKAREASWGANKKQTQKAA